MTRRRVLHNPDPELREISRPLSVAEITSDDMRALVADMKETMKLENGVGLAAPQINQKIRLIVAQTPRGVKGYFNPVITKRSEKLVDSEEGCLSVPGIFGVVKRHKAITVSVLNEKGEEEIIKTGGLLSVIFQHEIDHLDGVLFIDRAHSLHELTKEKEESIL